MRMALAVAVLLYTLLAATSTYTAAALASDASSSSTPLAALGINMHTHATPEQLLPVVAAGISIVRTDISWASIESVRGCYNFSTTDPYVASLQGAELRLLAIMDAGGHPMYDGGQARCTRILPELYRVKNAYFVLNLYAKC